MAVQNIVMWQCLRIYEKDDFSLLYMVGMAEVFMVYHTYFWLHALYHHGRLCPNKEGSAYFAKEKRLRWQQGEGDT